MKKNKKILLLLSSSTLTTTGMAFVAISGTPSEEVKEDNPRDKWWFSRYKENEYLNIWKNKKQENSNNLPINDFKTFKDVVKEQRIWFNGKTFSSYRGITQTNSDFELDLDSKVKNWVNVQEVNLDGNSPVTNHSANIERLNKIYRDNDSEQDKTRRWKITFNNYYLPKDLSTRKGGGNSNADIYAIGRPNLKFGFFLSSDLKIKPNSLKISIIYRKKELSQNYSDSTLVKQPDGEFINGRIYNFLEDKKELPIISDNSISRPNDGNINTYKNLNKNNTFKVYNEVLKLNSNNIDQMSLQGNLENFTNTNYNVYGDDDNNNSNYFKLVNWRYYGANLENKTYFKETIKNIFLGDKWNQDGYGSGGGRSLSAIRTFKNTELDFYRQTLLNQSLDNAGAFFQGEISFWKRGSTKNFWDAEYVPTIVVDFETENNSVFLDNWLPLVDNNDSGVFAAAALEHGYGYDDQNIYKSTVGTDALFYTRDSNRVFSFDVTENVYSEKDAFANFRYLPKGLGYRIKFGDKTIAEIPAEAIDKAKVYDFTNESISNKKLKIKYTAVTNFSSWVNENETSLHLSKTSDLNDWKNYKVEIIEPNNWKLKDFFDYDILKNYKDYKVRDKNESTINKASGTYIENISELFNTQFTFSTISDLKWSKAGSKKLETIKELPFNVNPSSNQSGDTYQNLNYGINDMLNEQQKNAIRDAVGNDWNKEHFYSGTLQSPQRVEFWDKKVRDIRQTIHDIKTIKLEIEDAKKIVEGKFDKSKFTKETLEEARKSVNKTQDQINMIRAVNYAFSSEHSKNTFKNSVNGLKTNDLNENSNLNFNDKGVETSSFVSSTKTKIDHIKNTLNSLENQSYKENNALINNEENALEFIESRISRINNLNGISTITKEAIINKIIKLDNRNDVDVLIQSIENVKNASIQLKHIYDKYDAVVKEPKYESLRKDNNQKYTEFKQKHDQISNLLDEFQQNYDSNSVQYDKLILNEINKLLNNLNSHLLNNNDLEQSYKLFNQDFEDAKKTIDNLANLSNHEKNAKKAKINNLQRQDEYRQLENFDQRQTEIAKVIFGAEVLDVINSIGNNIDNSNNKYNSSKNKDGTYNLKTELLKYYEENLQNKNIKTNIESLKNKFKRILNNEFKDLYQKILGANSKKEINQAQKDQLIWELAEFFKKDFEDSQNSFTKIAQLTNKLDEIKNQNSQLKSNFEKYAKNTSDLKFVFNKAKYTQASTNLKESFDNVVIKVSKVLEIAVQKPDNLNKIPQSIYNRNSNSTDYFEKYYDSNDVANLNNELISAYNSLNGNLLRDKLIEDISNVKNQNLFNLLTQKDISDYISNISNNDNFLNENNFENTKIDQYYRQVFDELLKNKFEKQVNDNDNLSPSDKEFLKEKFNRDLNLKLTNLNNAISAVSEFKSINNYYTAILNDLKNSLKYQDLSEEQKTSLINSIKNINSKTSADAMPSFNKLNEFKNNNINKLVNLVKSIKKLVKNVLRETKFNQIDQKEIFSKADDNLKHNLTEAFYSLNSPAFSKNIDVNSLKNDYDKLNSAFNDLNGLNNKLKEEVLKIDRKIKDLFSENEWKIISENPIQIIKNDNEYQKQYNLLFAKLKTEVDKKLKAKPNLNKSQKNGISRDLSNINFDNFNDIISVIEEKNQLSEEMANLKEVINLAKETKNIFNIRWNDLANSDKTIFESELANAKAYNPELNFQNGINGNITVIRNQIQKLQEAISKLKNADLKAQIKEKLNLIDFSSSIQLKEFKNNTLEYINQKHSAQELNDKLAEIQREINKDELQNILNEALEISSPNSKLSNAIQNATNALTNLQFKSQADFNDFKDLINEAIKFDQLEKYIKEAARTREKSNKLIEAIKKSQEAIESNNIFEIQKSIQKLEDIFKKEDLNKELDKAKQIANKNKFETLEKAIKSADKISLKPNATTEEIKLAKDKLLQEINQAQDLSESKKELEFKLQNNDDLKNSKNENIQNLYNNSKTILDNANSTKEEIQAGIQKIEGARKIDQLIKIISEVESIQNMSSTLSKVIQDVKSSINFNDTNQVEKIINNLVDLKRKESLNKELDKSNGINQANQSDKLKNAIKEAKEVIKNPDVTLEQVKNTKNKLYLERNKNNELYKIKEELHNELIKNSNFSTLNNKKIQDAYKIAQEVFNNSNVSKQEVQQAIKNLENAKKINQLEKEINQAKNTYNPSTKFIMIINQTKDLLNSKDLSQLEQAIANLNNAQAKEELNKELDKVNNFSEEEKGDILKDAIEEAHRVSNNLISSQEEVHETIRKLKYAQKVNLLEKLIQKAEKINNLSTKLTQEITKAKEASISNNIVQVEWFIVSLDDAIKKEALNKELEYVNEIFEWNKSTSLKEAIENANQIVQKINATIEEVNLAKEQIIQQKSKTNELIKFKQELKNQLNNNNDLFVSDNKIIQDTYKKAQNIVNNPNISKEEVKQAIKNLEDLENLDHLDYIISQVDKKNDPSIKLREVVDNAKKALESNNSLVFTQLIINLNDSLKKEELNKELEKANNLVEKNKNNVLKTLIEEATRISQNPNATFSEIKNIADKLVAENNKTQDFDEAKKELGSKLENFQELQNFANVNIQNIYRQSQDIFNKSNVLKEEFQQATKNLKNAKKAYELQRSIEEAIDKIKNPSDKLTEVILKAKQAVNLNDLTKIIQASEEFLDARNKERLNKELEKANNLPEKDKNNTLKNLIEVAKIISQNPNATWVQIKEVKDKLAQENRKIQYSKKTQDEINKEEATNYLIADFIEQAQIYLNQNDNNLKRTWTKLFESIDKLDVDNHDFNYIKDSIEKYHLLDKLLNEYYSSNIDDSVHEETKKKIQKVINSIELLESNNYPQLDQLIHQINYKIKDFKNRSIDEMRLIDGLLKLNQEEFDKNIQKLHQNNPSFKIYNKLGNILKELGYFNKENKNNENNQLIQEIQRKFTKEEFDNLPNVVKSILGKNLVTKNSSNNKLHLLWLITLPIGLGIIILISVVLFKKYKK
ncbi:hypothetical protein [Mycoplasmopsis sturni]|uniref:hypothetical protein n=1 Tax=Mycoplasmopsis sturni TaxID=39047 RepID=UPI0005698097|nr:hypothetical protein [Mycoplasmopsis sturni]